VDECKPLSGGSGRWTPDPFDNCRAFDLCSLAEYESKHRAACETERAAAAEVTN